MTTSAGSRSSAGELARERARARRVVLAPERGSSSAGRARRGRAARAGLLGDDLAEQRAEQPDLERERVARPGRPDPSPARRGRRRSGRRRAVDAAAHAATSASRTVTVPHPALTGPQPSAAASVPYACIVMPVTHRPRPRRPTSRTRCRATPPRTAEQLEQLRFLHEVARLATTARTWDELLETVVDGTRDALHADVSSLYLLDRDGAYLTLAATNGLDRFQIGRARVPFGEGVTGRVAATREPLVIPDVRADAALPVGPRHRPAPVRRLDAVSVPLSWNDQVVGVLNVQTEQPATFSRADVAQLGAIADLLAGHRREGPPADRGRGAARGAPPIDEARSELIALVTHELRTPLAVVRAYTELLADDPPLEGRESRDPSRRAPARGLARRGARAGRAARPPRRLDPRLGPGRPGGRRPRVTPTDVEARDRRGRRTRSGRSSASTTSTSSPASASTPWPTRRGSARSSSTSSRTR